MVPQIGRSISIELSIWDLGGQQRFEFFKSDFFKGCAAVGLVFDLARPDTFDKVDTYFNQIREMAGNIPIILVGNKSDLRKEIGDTVEREKIIQKVNDYNLFEYVETSALDDDNVNKLFNRLAICALLELKPRLGEIASDNRFRFKVILAGAAAVGKTSLIKTFVNKDFSQEYKITVGLDFMTQNFTIADEDLPKEIHKLIKEAKKKSPIPENGEMLKTQKEKSSDGVAVSVSKEEVEETVERGLLLNLWEFSQRILTHNYVYGAISLVLVVILLTVLVHFFFIG